MAQAFRTGSNAAGYTLTGIDLALRGGSGTPAYAVSIRSDSAGRPGNSLGTLTNPALQSGDHNAQFTVPGAINLAANTWYWVVVDVSTGDSTSLIWGTDSNHQDAGWATSWEWRIANNGLSRGAGSTAWQSRTGKMKIAVHGSGRTAPVQTGTRGLVSNTGRSSDTTGSFDTDYAQAFTTGSNAAGYRLTAADLDIAVDRPTGVLSSPAAYAVHIYSDASNSPGISLGSLRKPSRLSTGLNAFWPSFGGIDLNPGTTYWMVLDVSSAGNRDPRVALTDADAEDPGAATGWSIADSGRSRSSTGWTALTGNRALRIAIHADAKPPPATTGTGGLVSNFGQSSDDQLTFANDGAQAFTTGPSAGGYRLTGVEIGLRGGSGTPAYTVTVRSNASGGRPSNTVLGTLTNPALQSGDHVGFFTAPGGGIDLGPNTKYWVVVDVSTADGSSFMWRTTGDAEDAGAAAGWSIDDTSQDRTAGSTNWNSNAAAMKIAVHGSARIPWATPRGLVSNTGQSGGSPWRFVNDFAQAFTTGGIAAGYRLTGVDILFGLAGAPTYTVSIRSDAAGDPGASLTTLTNPASLPSGGGLARYTVPGGGIDLAPDTTYWVMTDITGEFLSTGFSATGSDAEDEGAAAGWRIADGARFRDQASTGSWSALSFVKQIAIRGHAKSASVPASPAVSVSEEDGTTLTVSWEAPVAAWPPVTGYDVRYRRKGDAAWTSHDHSGTATTATITDLLQGASWEAQVRARNGLGAGEWGTGSGHTGPARLAGARTNAEGTKVRLVFTKTIQNGSTLGSYSVAADGANRNLVGGPAWNTRDVTIGVAAANAVQRGESVTVSYAQPTGNTASKLKDADGQLIASFTDQPVTNAVLNLPAAPAAPDVSWVFDTDRLTVSWEAPANDGGSAVTDYDLRYWVTSDRNRGNAPHTDDPAWIDPEEDGGYDHVGLSTTATFTQIVRNSKYFVGVRAVNSEGAGPWSAAGGFSVGQYNLPPAALAAPTVTPVTGSPSLEVTWVASTVVWPAVTDYDLRYFAGTADPEDDADWVTENETTGLPSTSTTAVTHTITGLAPNTAYRVQVRAANSEGEGAWSDSGTATTNASTATNTAPVRERAGGGGCVEKAADTSWVTLTATPGTQVSTGPLVTQGATCGMFHDADGDGTLTFTALASSLPDDVILSDNHPFVSAPSGTVGGRVYVEGAARTSQTAVRIDVTATDAHGASVSTWFIARMGHLADTNGAPTFEYPAPPRQVAHNEEIEPFVLPDATGGDVGYTGSDGRIYRFPNPYTYAVTGLPAGLEFDPATREVSGTPTAAGAWTVTYKAGDADHVRSDADKAIGTFVIRVGHGPKIHRVRIVSNPTYDADGDGVPDTYVLGDRILIDVEAGAQSGRDEPMEIGGKLDHVRLRLDLGPDDADLGNSRRLLRSPEVRHGGETLRFAYTVVSGSDCGTEDASGDCDRDGVWVQTAPGASNQVVFVSGDSTLTHAVTGETVDLTLAGLPSDGSEFGKFAKVDGSKTQLDIGPRPTGAAVDGATLTATFSGNLDTSVDTDALRLDLLVAGAGQVRNFDGGVQHPSAISVSGATLTLTLGAPARAGETVTLSYVGRLLRGAGSDGKQAPMFRDLAVANGTGTAAPVPLRAAVRGAGKELKVHFDKALAGSLPAGSAFVVSTEDRDDDRRVIDGTGTAAVDGKVVTVTLRDAVRPDEQADVWYTKPASSPLKGAGTGNPEVLSFDNFPVRWIDDGTAPRLLGGAVVPARGNRSEFKMALYFDEALDGTSRPATGDFAVTAGGTVAHVTGVAVAGDNVVLVLNRPGAVSGTRFEASYTPGTNPIRDTAGNAAAAFRQTLKAGAGGAPIGQSAVVDGGRLALTYDRPLDPQSLPGPGRSHWTNRCTRANGWPSPAASPPPSRCRAARPCCAWTCRRCPATAQRRSR